MQSPHCDPSALSQALRQWVFQSSCLCTHDVFSRGRSHMLVPSGFPVLEIIPSPWKRNPLGTFSGCIFLPAGPQPPDSEHWAGICFQGELTAFLCDSDQGGAQSFLSSRGWSGLPLW